MNLSVFLLVFEAFLIRAAPFEPGKQLVYAHVSVSKNISLDHNVEPRNAEEFWARGFGIDYCFR